MNTTLDEAIRWTIQRGIATIPIKTNSKLPVVAWKRYQTELPTLSQLLRWFANSDYNLAVVCGWQDLTILDFDDISEYQAFVNKYPQFKDTFSVSTNRGMHVYTFCENVKTMMTPGLDIKSNGYVLCPPSVHPSGKKYEVVSDSEIMRVDEMPIAPSIETLPVTVNVNHNHGSVNINITHTNTRRSGSIIKDIKSRLAITDLFPDYHNSGDGMAIAHCPMPAHRNGDRHPSLSLDLKSNRCQCLKPGCQLHGRHGNDVIDAYRILNGLSFKQALKRMADGLGL